MVYSIFLRLFDVGVLHVLQFTVFAMYSMLGLRGEQTCLSVARYLLCTVCCRLRSEPTCSSVACLESVSASSFSIFLISLFTWYSCSFSRVSSSSTFSWRSWKYKTKLNKSAHNSRGRSSKGKGIRFIRLYPPKWYTEMKCSHNLSFLVGLYTQKPIPQGIFQSTWQHIAHKP